MREAARAALRANDAGEPGDGLLGALIIDFGMPDAEHLTRRVSDEPTTDNWAPHAPAVFAAADAGSRLAARIIEEGGAALTDPVVRLRGRGAIGTDVVAAGVPLARTSLRQAASSSTSSACSVPLKMR